MFTKSQERAMKLLESGRNVFLTGEAGTGKSFVLQEFIREMERKRKNIVVCAPTGVAAVHVGGVTMHSLFGLNPSMMSPTDERNVPKLVLRADCIVIDEISMCRGDLFYTSMQIIRKAQMMTKRNIQVVVVGDFYQLPPVLRKDELEAYHTLWLSEMKEEYCNYKYSERFPFTMKIWDAMNFAFVCLKEVVRQENIEFVSALEAARIGDKSSLEYMRNHANPNLQSSAIFLSGRNDDVALKNKHELDKLSTPVKVFKAEVFGKADPKNFLADEFLEIKVGSRVMMLVNDAEKRFVNGDMGVVVSISEEFMGFDGEVHVRLDKGNLVAVKPFEWEMNSYRLEEQTIPYLFQTKRKTENGWEDISPIQSEEPYKEGTPIQEGFELGYKKKNCLVKEIVGTYRQIPLKLAYAITIHKSQGQTFESVNLNPVCFDDGMLYVALSRVRDIKGLHIMGYLYERYLRCSPAVRRFYATQKEEAVPVENVSSTAFVPNIARKNVKKRKKKSCSFYVEEEEALFLKQCLKMLRESPEKIKELRSVFAT